MKEPDIQDVFVEINDIRGRLVGLENQSVVFNNTIIALALMANVKPNGFKYITPEDYKKFTREVMQPFAKVVMDVSQQANTLIQEEEDAKRASSEDKASAKDDSESAD